MKYLAFILVLLFSFQSADTPSADEILKKVDKNMSSKTKIFKSKMIIHGKRSTRTITSKTWTEGEDKSFTEYLAPAREKGTKMLKLKDKLWIYSPSTDRTIQIAGHMLRQSVMGSDLSYEDMMEDSKLTDNYNAKVTGSDSIDGRACYILMLTAKKGKSVVYQSRKIWIDKTRYVPLKENLYAKSGKLLKTTKLSNVTKVGKKWFPKKIVYDDKLKAGKGTEFIVVSMEFDKEIPEHIFTKGNLKK